MQSRPVAKAYRCLSLALALGMASCRGDDPAPTTGVARVVVRAAGDASGIARVIVRVSAGDGAPFSPSEYDLTDSGGQWIGRIDNIPVGSGRRFDAAAYDSRGVEQLGGTALADVQARAATVVAITLSAVTTSVVIDSVSWSPDWAKPRGVVRMFAAAHAQSVDQAITYRWTSECGAMDQGAFDAPTGAETSWTAPGQAATCHFALRVATSQGATAESDFTVPVLDGGIAPNNTYPVVNSLRALVRLGTPMEVDLAVEAVDPDGDPLTYQWSSDGPSGCPGISFETNPPYAPSAPHASLPPPVSACRVQVTVSDGQPAGTVGAVWLPPGMISP